MALDKTSTLTTTTSFGGGYAIPQLRHTFNNTSNWTVPDGVRGIFFVLAAGGAGGGAGGNGGNGGGGGGAGGVIFRAVNTTPGTTVAITIGAGGNGGSVNASAGNSGGASSITIGNLTYTMSGPTAGGVSNPQNPGNSQVTPIINSNAGAGTLSVYTPVQTNFKLELGVGYYNGTWQDSSSSGSGGEANTIISSGSLFNGGTSGGGTSGLNPTETGNIFPYYGSGTNWATNTNVYLGTSGNGGRSVGFSNYNGRASEGFVGPRHGGTGLTGGGGASTALGDIYSGSGGGGMGGAGGSANTVTSNRGGGGGGGLTGAGNTSNTSSGGNGGTGGGAGGGGVQNGNGGTGGAGACLIYY